jgi:hypothetical protein
MKLADVIKVAKSFKMADAHRFAKHVVPEVVKPARIIWNQAIGAFFLVLTVFFLGYAVSDYRQMAKDPNLSMRFGMALFMGSVMLFFCISSFMKARKIGRPRGVSGRP